MQIDRTEIFHPISGTRAFEEVAEQLTFAIRSGTYAVGSRLPSIDELSKKMCVSKPTVGQALKMLADASIVEVVRGVRGGTVVKSNLPLQKSISDALLGPSYTFTELVEARRPIEIEIAIRASKYGTPTEFEELEENIEALIKHANSDQTVRTFHDHRFHYLMGKMSRNRLLAVYQHQILERLYMEMAQTEFLQSVEDVSDVVAWHRATLEALLDGDELKIRSVITDHLGPLEAFVSGSESVR